MPRVEESPVIVWSQRGTSSTIPHHQHQYQHQHQHHHHHQHPRKTAIIVKKGKGGSNINSNSHNIGGSSSTSNSSSNGISNINSSESRSTAASSSAAAMKSIKTTGSDRSARRVQRHRSRSSSDNHFELQHEHMLSRQQFRTNTSRLGNNSAKKGSGSGSNGNGNGSFSANGNGIGNGNGSFSANNNNNTNTTTVMALSSNNGNGGTTKHRVVNSLHGTDSYESGYSHMSRRSDHLGGGPPRTIHKTDHDRNETIHNVKIIISDLNKAIGHERRIAAITNACAEFDHWDTDKHNIELQLGCSNVLSMVLSMTDNEDEIRMICAALEMVYRASTAVVSKTFQDVGPDVVPLLLKLLEQCETTHQKHAAVSIINITKVLLYFSRVAELRTTLARHGGMLDTLTRVAFSTLSPDCRVLRMRVIANLSNSEENKVMMMSHSGLLDAILKIAALDLSDKAREYASASLMDLASSTKTQVPMANHDKLLSTLVKLAVTDEGEETREYAVTAMQNLAFSKENRERLVTYADGVVVEALKKALSVDTNEKSRRRAAGALTNLACEETAELMSTHNGLVEILSRVITQDKNDDVQKRASLALSKIASSCATDSRSFESTMNALVVAATSPNSTGIPAVFRVKARNASRRSEMARIPGLIETLADMSTSPSYTSKDRDNATRAIMHLTNESDNRKIMCNKVVLKALLEASNLDGSEDTETRDSAIVAIERLATEVSNRQYMARHDGLLVAIAKATERESKSELAGEKNSQPRLAKQLLMSLLLAM
mmetsp:Transcript_26350/g.39500  ORF Transcript_26350/g.39500 Transcript_26350/m.39500 type:complete len:775 (-) Transcript_26350:174-2498(-)